MKGNRKAPVTLGEVAEAMRELREEGVTLSVRAVQERVGRGSFTTITKHMAAASAGIETPEQHLEQFSPRLEALCKEMISHMNELAAERVSQEREHVEAMRRNIESRWNNLVMEKETAVTNLDNERRTNVELRQRLADTMQQLESARAALAESTTRAAAAETQVAQLNERIKDSTQQIERQQAYINNYEAHVAQQRQRDAEEHSAKLGAMESALNASRSKELNLTTQLGDANRTNERISADLRAAELRCNQAVAEHSRLQALVAQLSVEQNESKKREERIERQLAESLATRESLQGEVTKLQSQLIAAQGRIDKVRDDATAESRSVILNLVSHSRRLFEMAQTGHKKSSPELQELGIAQKEIERLFN